MSLCPSCGGVLGRDCYNPTECAQISLQSDQYETYRLNQKVDFLIKILNDNNIEIPDFETEIFTDIDLDDLPF